MEYNNLPSAATIWPVVKNASVQFGGSMFASEIVENQGGKGCFSVCDTTKPGPEHQSCLISLTHTQIHHLEGANTSMILIRKIA